MTTAQPLEQATPQGSRLAGDPDDAFAWPQFDHNTGDGHTHVHHSFDDLPGDALGRLRLSLLLSGVTVAEVAQHLGVARSTIGHQLTGHDRLQPATSLTIVRMSAERLSSLAAARPFERRLLIGSGGVFRPIIDYSAAGGDTPVFTYTYTRDFDRMRWFHLRKCVGLLTAGTVSAYDYAGPHVRTAMGDHLNVYTTVRHAAHKDYGFKKVSSDRHGVFICRPTAAYALDSAEVYLVPPSVITHLSRGSGNLFIPERGWTSRCGERWPGRDLREYAIDLSYLRSLASACLPTEVRWPAANGEAVRPSDGRGVATQCRRWSTSEESRMLSLWGDPNGSLSAAASGFPGRSLPAVLAHARKLGLPTPPWMPAGHREWSAAEDRLLLMLVDATAADDEVLQVAFPSRSPKSLRARLRRIRAQDGG